MSGEPALDVADVHQMVRSLRSRASPQHVAVALAVGTSTMDSGQPYSEPAVTCGYWTVHHVRVHLGYQDTGSMWRTSPG